MSAGAADPTPEVVVVGSVHMDVMATADRVPLPGESVLGNAFSMHPGGKAGNQAVSAARQGAHSAIVARVGDDAFGQELRSALARKGVDVSWLQVDDREATGVSPVLMGADGVYASIIVPGASRVLGPAELGPAATSLRRCAVALLQLEIDVATTWEAARLAAAGTGRVVLNASPPLSRAAVARDLWSLIDVVIVNQVEAEALLGRSEPAVEPARLAVRLREVLRVAAAIVTLGGSGVVAADEAGEFSLPAHDVTVVDTIGAGDAFAGAVAAALARALDLREAVAFGNAAGALAVGMRGAHEAPPTLAETRELLARRLVDFA